MQPPLCVSVWGTSWGCGKEDQRAGVPPIPPTRIADNTHSLKQWYTRLFSAVKVHVTSPLPAFIVWLETSQTPSFISKAKTDVPSPYSCILCSAFCFSDSSLPWP